MTVEEVAKFCRRHRGTEAFNDDSLELLKQVIAYYVHTGCIKVVTTKRRIYGVLVGRQTNELEPMKYQELDPDGEKFIVDQWITSDPRVNSIFAKWLLGMNQIKEVWAMRHDKVKRVKHSAIRRIANG